MPTATACLQLYVLVLDTDIILLSLAMVGSLVESRRWTVVVPLPTIIKFVASHICSCSDTLKMQTSRGSYLSSFSVCADQVDFDDPDLWKWSMDDLILKVAV